MQKPSITTRFLRLINGLIALTVAVLLGLLVLDVVKIAHLEDAVGQVKNTLPWPRVIVGACVFLFLFLTLYNLIARLSSNPYQTHLRSETEDGEVSIAVHAVEDTLKRAVTALGDIKEANVEVMKKSADVDGQIHVRTTVVTHEKTKFRDIVKHVRSILNQRWNEIIEMEESPYMEIVLGDVSEDPSNNDSFPDENQDSNQTKNEEDPYLSDTFSGPKYPVDEDEES